MHIVFQLHDVLSLDSTVIIYVLTTDFVKFRSLECMNTLLDYSQHVRLNYFAVANAENL